MNEPEEPVSNTIFFESLQRQVSEVQLPSEISTAPQTFQDLQQPSNSFNLSNAHQPNNPPVIQSKSQRNLQVKSVSTSTSFTLIVSNDGLTWMVGHLQAPNNSNQKLNKSPNSSFVDSITYELENQSAQQIPRLISNLPKIASVTTGRHHAFLVSKLGQVYAYGWDSHQKGILGLDGSISCEYPQIIRSLAAYRVVQISTSEHHALALTESGKVFSWGDNSQGQLGISESASNQCACKPQKIDLVELYSCKSLICMPSASIFLTKGGNLFLTVPGGLLPISPNLFPNTSDELIFTDIVSNGDILVCLTMQSQIYAVDITQLIWKQLKNSKLSSIESLNSSRTSFFALSTAEKYLLEYDAVEIKKAFHLGDNTFPEPQIYALNKRLDVCMFASAKESSKVALTYKIKPYDGTQPRNTSVQVSNNHSRLFETIHFPRKKGTSSLNTMNYPMLLPLDCSSTLETTSFPISNRQRGKPSFNQPTNHNAFQNNNDSLILQSFEPSFIRKIGQNITPIDSSSNSPFRLSHNAISSRHQSPENSFIICPISSRQASPDTQRIGQQEWTLFDAENDPEILLPQSRQVIRITPTGKNKKLSTEKLSRIDIPMESQSIIGKPDSNSKNYLRRERVSSKNQPFTNQDTNKISSNINQRQRSNNNYLKTISDRNNSSNTAQNMSFWEQWRATSGGAMHRTKKDLEYFIDLIYSGAQTDGLIDNAQINAGIQRQDIERALQELDIIEREKNNSYERERQEIKRYIEESKRALQDLHVKQQMFQERLDRQDSNNSRNDWRNNQGILDGLISEREGIESFGQNDSQRRIKQEFAALTNAWSRDNHQTKSANHSYDRTQKLKEDIKMFVQGGDSSTGLQRNQSISGLIPQSNNEKSAKIDRIRQKIVGFAVSQVNSGDKYNNNNLGLFSRNRSNNNGSNILDNNQSRKVFVEQEDDSDNSNQIEDKGRLGKRKVELNLWSKEFDKLQGNNDKYEGGSNSSSNSNKRNNDSNINSGKRLVVVVDQQKQEQQNNPQLQQPKQSKINQKYLKVTDQQQQQFQQQQQTNSLIEQKLNKKIYQLDGSNKPKTSGIQNNSRNINGSTLQKLQDDQSQFLNSLFVDKDTESKDIPSQVDAGINNQENSNIVTQTNRQQNSFLKDFNFARKDSQDKNSLSKQNKLPMQKIILAVNLQNEEQILEKQQTDRDTGIDDEQNKISKQKEQMKNALLRSLQSSPKQRNDERTVVLGDKLKSIRNRILSLNNSKGQQQQQQQYQTQQSQMANNKKQESYERQSTVYSNSSNNSDRFSQAVAERLAALKGKTSDEIEITSPSSSSSSMQLKQLKEEKDIRTFKEKEDINQINDENDDDYDKDGCLEDQNQGKVYVQENQTEPITSRKEEQEDLEESRKQSNHLDSMGEVGLNINGDINTNESKCFALCLRLEKMILARESYAMRKLIAQSILWMDKQQYEKLTEQQNQQNQQQQQDKSLKLMQAGMYKVSQLVRKRKVSGLQGIKGFKEEVEKQGIEVGIFEKNIKGDIEKKDRDNQNNGNRSKEDGNEQIRTDNGQGSQSNIIRNQGSSSPKSDSLQIQDTVNEDTVNQPVNVLKNKDGEDNNNCNDDDNQDILLLAAGNASKNQSDLTNPIKETTKEVKKEEQKAEQLLDFGRFNPSQDQTNLEEVNEQYVENKTISQQSHSVGQSQIINNSSSIRNADNNLVAPKQIISQKTTEQPKPFVLSGQSSVGANQNRDKINNIPEQETDSQQQQSSSISNQQNDRTKPVQSQDASEQQTQELDPRKTLSKEQGQELQGTPGYQQQQGENINSQLQQSLDTKDETILRKEQQVNNDQGNKNLKDVREKQSENYLEQSIYKVDEQQEEEEQIEEKEEKQPKSMDANNSQENSSSCIDEDTKKLQQQIEVVVDSHRSGQGQLGQQKELVIPSDIQQSNTEIKKVVQEQQQSNIEMDSIGQEQQQSKNEQIEMNQKEYSEQQDILQQQQQKLERKEETIQKEFNKQSQLSDQINLQEKQENNHSQINNNSPQQNNNNKEIIGLRIDEVRSTDMLEKQHLKESAQQSKHDNDDKSSQTQDGSKENQKNNNTDIVVEGKEHNQENTSSISKENEGKGEQDVIARKQDRELVVEEESQSRLDSQNKEKEKQSKQEDNSKVKINNISKEADKEEEEEEENEILRQQILNQENNNKQEQDKGDSLGRVTNQVDGNDIEKDQIVRQENNNNNKGQIEENKQRTSNEIIKNEGSQRILNGKDRLNMINDQVKDSNNTQNNVNKEDIKEETKQENNNNNQYQLLEKQVQQNKEKMNQMEERLDQEGKNMDISDKLEGRLYYEQSDEDQKSNMNIEQIPKVNQGNTETIISKEVFGIEDFPTFSGEHTPNEQQEQDKQEKYQIQQDDQTEQDSQRSRKLSQDVAIKVRSLLEGFKKGKEQNEEHQMDIQQGQQLTSDLLDAKEGRNDQMKKDDDQTNKIKEKLDSRDAGMSSKNELANEVDIIGQKKGSQDVLDRKENTKDNKNVSSQEEANSLEQLDNISQDGFGQGRETNSLNNQIASNNNLKNSLKIGNEGTLSSSDDQTFQASQKGYSQYVQQMSADYQETSKQGRNNNNNELSDDEIQVQYVQQELFQGSQSRIPSPRENINQEIEQNNKQDQQGKIIDQVDIIQQNIKQQNNMKSVITGTNKTADAVGSDDNYNNNTEKINELVINKQEEGLISSTDSKQQDNYDIDQEEALKELVREYVQNMINKITDRLEKQKNNTNHQQIERNGSTEHVEVVITDMNKPGIAMDELDQEIKDDHSRDSDFIKLTQTHQEQSNVINPTKRSINEQKSNSGILNGEEESDINTPSLNNQSSGEEPDQKNIQVDDNTKEQSLLQLSSQDQLEFNQQKQQEQPELKQSQQQHENKDSQQGNNSFIVQYQNNASLSSSTRDKQIPIDTQQQVLRQSSQIERQNPNNININNRQVRQEDSNFSSFELTISKDNFDVNQSNIPEHHDDNQKSLKQSDEAYPVTQVGNLNNENPLNLAVKTRQSSQSSSNQQPQIQHQEDQCHQKASVEDPIIIQAQSDLTTDKDDTLQSYPLTFKSKPTKTNGKSSDRYSSLNSQQGVSSIQDDISCQEQPETNSCTNQTPNKGIIQNSHQHSDILYQDSIIQQDNKAISSSSSSKALVYQQSIFGSPANYFDPSQRCNSSPIFSALKQQQQLQQGQQQQQDSPYQEYHQGHQQFQEIEDFQSTQQPTQQHLKRNQSCNSQGSYQDQQQQQYQLPSIGKNAHLKRDNISQAASPTRSINLVAPFTINQQEAYNQQQSYPQQQITQSNSYYPPQSRQNNNLIDSRISSQLSSPNENYLQSYAPMTTQSNLQNQLSPTITTFDAYLLNQGSSQAPPLPNKITFESYLRQLQMPQEENHSSSQPCIQNPELLQKNHNSPIVQHFKPQDMQYQSNEQEQYYSSYLAHTLLKDEIDESKSSSSNNNNNTTNFLSQQPKNPTKYSSFIAQMAKQQPNYPYQSNNSKELSSSQINSAISTSRKTPAISNDNRYLFDSLQQQQQQQQQRSYRESQSLQYPQQQQYLTPVSPQKQRQGDFPYEQRFQSQELSQRTAENVNYSDRFARNLSPSVSDILERINSSFLPLDSMNNKSNNNSQLNQSIVGNNYNLPDGSKNSSKHIRCSSSFTYSQTPGMQSLQNSQQQQQQQQQEHQQCSQTQQDSSSQLRPNKANYSAQVEQLLAIYKNKGVKSAYDPQNNSSQNKFFGLEDFNDIARRRIQPFQDGNELNQDNKNFEMANNINGGTLDQGQEQSQVGQPYTGRNRFQKLKILEQLSNERLQQQLLFPRQNNCGDNQQYIEQQQQQQDQVILQTSPHFSGNNSNNNNNNGTNNFFKSTITPPTTTSPLSNMTTIARSTTTYVPLLPATSPQAIQANLSIIRTTQQYLQASASPQQQQSPSKQPPFSYAQYSPILPTSVKQLETSINQSMKAFSIRSSIKSLIQDQRNLMNLSSIYQSPTKQPNQAINQSFNFNCHSPGQQQQNIRVCSPALQFFSSSSANTSPSRLYPPTELVEKQRSITINNSPARTALQISLVQEQQQYQPQKVFRQFQLNEENIISSPLKEPIQYVSPRSQISEKSLFGSSPQRSYVTPMIRVTPPPSRGNSPMEEDFSNMRQQQGYQQEQGLAQILNPNIGMKVIMKQPFPMEQQTNMQSNALSAPKFPCFIPNYSPKYPQKQQQ